MIMSIFSFSYAVGLLLAGDIIDRVRTKKGYAGAVILWSFAAISHFFVKAPRVTSRLGLNVHFFSRSLEHVPLIGNSGWVASIGTLSSAVLGFCLVRVICPAPF
jgi:hypothetical protein